jgi:hypothetical protein
MGSPGCLVQLAAGHIVMLHDWESVGRAQLVMFTLLLHILREAVRRPPRH